MRIPTNELDELMTEVPCAACQGRRFNPRAQAVKVDGKTIWEVAGLLRRRRTRIFRQARSRSLG